MLLLCLTLFPNRLFNNTSALIGYLWLFGILFFSLYITAKISMKHLKGNHFACYFLFIVLSLSAYMFHLACLFVPSVFPDSNSAALLMITIMTAVLILSSATFFIRYRFHDQLLRLNHLGKKYQNIEKYFPCFSALILFLFMLILVPFTVLQLHNSLIMLLLPCTVATVRQPFIKMRQPTSNGKKKKFPLIIRLSPPVFPICRECVTILRTFSSQWGIL